MVATRVTSEPHMLFARYILWNGNNKLGEIDIDLATVMNSRGFDFKKEFIHKTFEEAEAIANKPVEYFKERVNGA